MPNKRRRRRPLPEAIDTRSLRAGLRSIAVFEGLKGVLVLAIACGGLSLLHKDIGDAAEALIRRIHLNPASHYPRIFLEAAERATDAKLWAIAGAAAAYATVRFVEAYGLWNARVWAEWFALLSGGLYLPWEIYGLLDHATALRWAVFVTNLAIVLYMLYVRVRAIASPE